MAWPISASSASSSCTLPRVRPDSSRATASSWRTVPTRQGTHWPQVSSRKKAAMPQQDAPRSTVSSSDEHDARAERGADLPRVLERQRHVELVGR